MLVSPRSLIDSLRSRDALVANYSGLTRDRKYGDGEMFDRRFMVIDTGGISGEEEGIDRGYGRAIAAGDG